MSVLLNAISERNKLDRVFAKESKKISEIEGDEVKVLAFYPHTAIDSNTGEKKDNFVAETEDFYFYTPSSLTDAINDVIGEGEDRTKRLESLNAELASNPDVYIFERIKIKDGRTYIKTVAVG